VAPKLLLDEHISPTIAHRLTELGFDVVCVRDRGLLGFEDWDLMEWCGNEGRAICTNNEDDFETEHQKYSSRGESHFGIIIVGEWSTDEIFAVLRAFLEKTEDVDPLDQIVELQLP